MGALQILGRQEHTLHQSLFLECAHDSHLPIIFGNVKLECIDGYDLVVHRDGNREGVELWLAWENRSQT